MFYSLAHLEESFHQHKTLRFIASTPCFWTPYIFDMNRYVNSLEQFDDYGVYSFNAESFTADKQTICDNFDTWTCNYMKSFDGKGEAVRTEKHWTQNTLAQRFQEFMPDD